MPCFSKSAAITSGSGGPLVWSGIEVAGGELDKEDVPAMIIGLSDHGSGVEDLLAACLHSGADPDFHQPVLVDSFEECDFRSGNRADHGYREMQ